MLANHIRAVEALKTFTYVLPFQRLESLTASSTPGPHSQRFITMLACLSSSLVASLQSYAYNELVLLELTAYNLEVPAFPR